MKILFNKKEKYIHSVLSTKSFKDKEKFIKLVYEFKVHKSTTIIFKINIFTLIDKQPKLMKSSMTLDFLKNYYKGIKQICKENSNEFQ